MSSDPLPVTEPAFNPKPEPSAEKTATVSTARSPLMRRFLSGSLFGIGFMGIKTLVNLILIPMLLAKIGSEQYGLFVLLIGFTELAFLLDMGFSAAFTQQLSIHAADSRWVREALTVGHGFYLGLSVLAAILGMVLLPWFVPLFHIPQALSADAQQSAFLILAIMVIYLYSSYYRAVLLSQTLHQWNHIADGVNHVLGNVLGMVLVMQGYGLPGFMAARVFSAGLMLLIVVAQARLLDLPVFTWVRCRWSMVKELLKTSGYTSVSHFSIILAHHIDTLVIGLFLPLSAVGLYEIIFRFLGVISQLMTKISMGIMPVFARQLSQSDMDGARRFYRALGSFTAVAGWLTLALVALHFDYFLVFFSANQYQFAEALPLLLVSIPLVLTGLVQAPSSMFLLANSEFKPLAVSSLITALCNVILSFLLVKPLGIMGVILGSLIPHGVQHQVAIIRKACHGLGIAYPQYMVQTILRPMVMVLPLLALAFGVKTALIQWQWLNLLTVGLNCGVFMILGLSLYYGFWALPSERVIVKTTVKRTASKLLNQIRCTLLSRFQNPKNQGLKNRDLKRAPKPSSEIIFNRDQSQSAEVIA